MKVRMDKICKAWKSFWIR